MNVRVDIYPHPVAEFAHVAVKGIHKEPLVLELFDTRGRRKKRLHQLPSGTFRLCREGLRGGYYLYRIISESAGIVAHGKLLVTSNQPDHSPQKLQ